jgi:hypothetical protein
MAACEFAFQTRLPFTTTIAVKARHSSMIGRGT